MTIPPQSVLSPKAKLEPPLTIVHTTPAWSVATAFWEGTRSLMIRWNGAEGALGSPVLDGEPSWFVLPPQLHWATLSVAADDARIAAMAWLHEGQAREGTPTHGDTAA